MSCEEMIETYEFQGACCSMESIPATKGCRITVSIGNCFWYPFCGTCEEGDPSKCNKQFTTDAGITCPMVDFNPLEAQKAVGFQRPSCAPTMVPVDPSTVTDAGTMMHMNASTPTGAAALLVAVVATMFAAA